MDDHAAMVRALRLARAGTGATYPNPCVGAVVVKRGRVVGAARSGPAGRAHAEVRALTKAGTAARGATLYVTMEPCSHTGRTGPCTEAIEAAGIAQVVVGVRDPARHAGGRGLRALRRAGIGVRTGIMAAEAEAVHEHYLHHVRTGAPFVTLKAAVSLDGRIAAPGGDSKWITGTTARRHAHRLRAQHHAIAVGVQTVLHDDPRLDVRLVRGVAPVPVVFDSRLRLGATGRGRFKVLRPGALVVHTRAASGRARERIRRTGAEPIEVAANARGRVDVARALAALGVREVRSLLVEGGGVLHGAFVAAGAWQRMYIYQAPRLLGEGRPAVGGVSWDTVAAAPRVTVETRRTLGEDFLTVVVPR